MELISKSIHDKSIHHFSLDFGSALLANIIHAPSTLAHLSAKSTYAQNVHIWINLVNVNNVKVYALTDSSISFNAYSYMSIIFIKGIIFQSSKIELQICWKNQWFRGILFPN